MDSYPSLIPIKHVLKVSEEDLRAKLEFEDDEVFSETKAIKEISKLTYRIDLQLQIHHNDAGEDKKIFAVYLTLLNIEEDVKIGSNFVFCIKPAAFLEYNDEYHTHDDESNGVYVCDFDDLFDPEEKFIVDGEFVIEMKAIIFLKKKEVKIKQIENGLIERLWEDFDEQDFKIVVKENNGCKTVFKVHKIVLALRSPVFKRMFKTDMKEKQEGKVEIIDFDFYTVQTAVEFCYDQEIFDRIYNWQQLVDLHRFADKYDIEDLKRKTEFKLAEEISLENISAVTNAVIKLNAPKLLDFCFRFLLMAVKEGIPVKDISNLDNEPAADVLKKSLSIEYC